jgi:hypothetical protein
LARTLAAVAVVGGLGVGAYALRIATITGSAQSHIPAEVIAASRHTPPFPYLRPENHDRYTAFLADYVTIGKGALLQRSAGSRYFRAFSPGIVLLALAAVGLASRRPGRARLWTSLAVWAAVVSTGPFLPLTETLALGHNPAWRLIYEVLGGKIILEPFRYALPAAMCLAVAAAVGVEELERRRLPGALAIPAWLLELVLVSPVPVPLPTADVSVDPTWRRLGETLAPGAILELPYFDAGTDRFRRVHFLHQLEHRRPIPDQLVGFPPPFLTENAFTASLLAPESRHSRLRVPEPDPARIVADREALATAGISTIVVDPSGYESPAVWEEVRARLAAGGDRPTVLVLGDETASP